MKRFWIQYASVHYKKPYKQPTTIPYYHAASFDTLKECEKYFMILFDSPLYITMKDCDILIEHPFIVDTANNERYEYDIVNKTLIEM